MGKREDRSERVYGIKILKKIKMGLSWSINFSDIISLVFLKNFYTDVHKKNK